MTFLRYAIDHSGNSTARINFHVTLAFNSDKKLGAPAHKVILSALAHTLINNEKNKMSELAAKEDICHENQTVFCKYNCSCKQTHDNELCKNLSKCSNINCIKIHLKVCKNFQSKGCRFKGGCTYTNVQQTNEDNLLLVQTLASYLKEVFELK